jgi:hypothetical protein
MSTKSNGNLSDTDAGADFEKAGQGNIGIDYRLAYTFCLFKVTDLERTVHVFAHFARITLFHHLSVYFRCKAAGIDPMSWNKLRGSDRSWESPFAV